jgi:hypothetical protein
LTSGRRPVVKIISESLSQHDEKHVVPTPLSEIRAGGRFETELSGGETLAILIKSLEEYLRYLYYAFGDIT